MKEPKFEIGALVRHIASEAPMVILGRGTMVYENDQFEIMYMASSIHEGQVRRHLVIESEIIGFYIHQL